MKTPTACRECRLGKRRCTPGTSGGACNECRRRGTSCSLTRATSVATGNRVILPQKSSDQSHVANNDIELDARARIELGRLYISLIHDKPHTLFHPPTLLRQLNDGSLPPEVMYGIFSMASRFSDQEDTRALSGSFLALAIDHLKRDIDTIELSTIQACVLVGNSLGAEGKYDAESLYFGFAFRMAQILGISRSSALDDEVLRETKLRVWWSLYMIDRWSSAGSGLPREIHENGLVPLPMEELQFESLQPTMTNPSVVRPGLWGHMIQLAQIFGGVQDLHRQLVEHVSEPDAEATTQSLSNELEAFIHRLPAGTRLTEENAEWYGSRRLGSAFVALHLGFHHYSTLLYFHYLDLQLKETSTVAQFASKCRYHAAAFSDLLELSTRIPGCDAVYFIVAHMTVVSSATLLHTLLFGDHSELQKTRERLKFNFETLVRLRKHWPAVGDLMERLFVFQNACMWSVDPNTHRIDRWMVRFLLQHNLPVPEKYYTQSHDSSVRGVYADDAMAILKEQSNWST